MEYSKIARGTFSSTGAAKVIYLPFEPSIIKMINYSAAGTPTQNGVPFADWHVGMGQGYGVIQAFNATPVLTTDVMTSGGFSTFTAGSDLQYGAQIGITGITKASPAAVTTSSPHGYSTGDVVIFQGLYQSSTTGMPQICNMPFVITKTGASTFTIPWNTNQSNFTALSAGPTGAYVKKVLYPFLYAPGVSVITAITLGATTTIDTTAPHNLVVGQEVAFRIPASYGTIQLNSLPNTVIPGSPIYGFVTTVNSATEVVVNINSSAFTAFNSNQTVASVPGLSFPQMVAVGDVNTGGVAYSGGLYYPSPVINSLSTMNGPAISGAYVNNTRRGFVIGAGAGATLSSTVLVGANGNAIYWEAMYTDMVV
jgi:hypothetical protein